MTTPRLVILIVVLGMVCLAAVAVGIAVYVMRSNSTPATPATQVLDMCDDNDTPHKNQCTLNSQKYGCNFLLDIEAYTAKRLFGANTNPDQVEKKVLWQVVGQGRQF